MKKILIIFPVFFIIFFLTSEKVIPLYKIPEPPKILRVAITKNAPEIFLQIKSPYRILELDTNKSIEKMPYLRKIKIAPSLKGIIFGTKELKTYAIVIIPQIDSTIYVDNKRLRGCLDIIQIDSSRLLVVNHIRLEDYLRGVLYHEVSQWWPMETLKAQAIASRTYALYQNKLNKDKDYDLTSDEYSQVYGGRFSERWRTNLAINSTRNKVLTYKGEILPTYYHATCGGYTEDAADIWRMDIEPLKGVRCNFCRNSPHYFWAGNISFLDIESRLSEAGFEIGKIDSINIVDRCTSGRIKNIEIKSRDASLTIPAKDFRNIIGNNIIRSTNFKLDIAGDRIFFEGYGWGHGVGMCQWGAYFMAKQRYKAEEILSFYYPGAKIVEYK